MRKLPPIYQEDGLAKQLRGSICTVLCRHWDPLAIGARAAGRETYRRHVPALFIMIVDGFASADIAEYLEMVGQEYPDRRGASVHARWAADALCALRVPYNLAAHAPAAEGTSTAGHHV